MDEVTATFIAATVAAIAAIVAAAFAILGARRTNYTNAIVASRIRWISELREDFSRLFADAEHIFETSVSATKENNAQAAREYLGASLRLRLRLNATEDVEILRKLEKLERAVVADCRGGDWQEFEREKMIPEVQALLKREWDKSKREAARIW